jgi:hypothetical protein
MVCKEGNGVKRRNNMVEAAKKEQALATREDQAMMIREGASLFFNVAKFEHAQRVARVFAESTMVPGQFKGNIGNCVIALNFAERMHVDPFMLMQNMYIVHGRPGVEAKLAIALINGSGKFTDPLDFEMEGEGTDKQKCRAYGTREGTKKVVYGPWVTWQMVVDEGWNKDKTNRQTGEVIKSKWNSLRDLMFNYRAAMFFARLHCPEVLLGLQTTEEILDFVDLERQVNGSYQMKETPEDLTKRIHESAKEKEEKPAPEDPIREQYINLRSAGFSTWVHKNLDMIRDLDTPYRDEIKTKWQKLYPEDSYPLDKEESPTTGQIATPSVENEPEKEVAEPKTIGDRVYDVQCNNPEIAMDYTYREFCETRCAYKDRKDGSVCEDYMNYLKAKGEA